MQPKMVLFTVALLLIVAGATTTVRASIIETLIHTGYLDKVAKEQAVGNDVTPETEPPAAAPGEETAPALAESEQSDDFRFVLIVAWPEGQIPGDAEGVALEVMSIFREAATQACASIPGGPGPVMGVSFPTDSSVQYACAPISAPEKRKFATAEKAPGL